MTDIDLDAPRYTNGVTRNTVRHWLADAEAKRSDGFGMSAETHRVIDLCMSWLDIEQQLVELRKENNALELRVEYLMYEGE